MLMVRYNQRNEGWQGENFPLEQTFVNLKVQTRCRLPRMMCGVRTNDMLFVVELNAWVLGAVFRNSHWVGSASMANLEEEGVVDNRLRVFGVKKLRVADASVIPAIPNGNVHSSVLMVASHAAELIRADEKLTDR